MNISTTPQYKHETKQWNNKVRHQTTTQTIIHKTKQTKPIKTKMHITKPKPNKQFIKTSQTKPNWGTIHIKRKSDKVIIIVKH